MARVAVVPSATSTTQTSIASAGLTDFVTGAGNGIEFSNSGKVIVVILAGVGAVSVTAKIPKTHDGVAANDKTIALLANAHVVLGPFAPSDYNDTSGKVAIDVDAASKYKVLSIP